MDDIVLKYLALFADSVPHSEMDVFYMGLSICRYNKKLNNKLIRKMFDNRWVSVEKQFNVNELRNFKLTEKGDEAFRYYAICKGGNATYYKMFSRTPRSADKYGEYLGKQYYF